jgi:uncharacterized membrane protein YccC
MSGPANSSAIATRSENTFHLQQAFKLALSLVLFYWLALWMNWDVPHYGALAIVIVSLGTTGATIEKGVARFVGTTAGVAIGFVILGLFCHDRWAIMLAFALYVAVIGYFMQGSRNSYAWYVAAFVPLVVWGSNYPNFNTAFYFGTFRWLETTVGILIYTMVDLVLWPRQAGDQLNQQGQQLWAEVRELLGDCRRRLNQPESLEDNCSLRTRLSGTLSRTASTLQDAYVDTPAVQAQKRVWEHLGSSARALVDALELWRESFDGCAKLDLDTLLPELGRTLDTLDTRLERIGALWEQRHTGDDASDDGDHSLVTTLDLDFDRSTYERLSHWQRAALMNFLAQMRNLDQVSCDLLRTMRVLTGVESDQAVRIPQQSRRLLRLPRWNAERALHALFPPAAFIAAFFLWIFMCPPTGPKIPMMAGVLALVILRTPMNPLALLAVLLLSTFFAVAPVYWLVMPGLSTGLGLLSLVFVYSFVFGYLGGRSPALKSGPVIMFTTMTGISNQQSYSFNGPVDGALMVLIAGVTVAVVYFAFSYMRPEQALMRAFRQLFQGCARVIAGPVLERGKGRSLRRQCIESMVLPAPAKIQAAQNRLDLSLYEEQMPNKLQRLHDSVQSLVYRLQSLEISVDRYAEDSKEVPEPFSHIGRRLGDTLGGVFERWASLYVSDEGELVSRELQDLSRDLKQQFEALDTDPGQVTLSHHMLMRLYAVLGSVRGLVEAMSETRNAMGEINWQQFAAARF